MICLEDAQWGSATEINKKGDIIMKHCAVNSQKNFFFKLYMKIGRKNNRIPEGNSFMNKNK